MTTPGSFSDNQRCSDEYFNETSYAHDIPITIYSDEDLYPTRTSTRVAGALAYGYANPGTATATAYYTNSNTMNVARAF